jgi:hypothetical protein
VDGSFAGWADMIVPSLAKTFEAENPRHGYIKGQAVTTKTPRRLSIQMRILAASKIIDWLFLSLSVFHDSCRSEDW